MNLCLALETEEAKYIRYFPLHFQNLQECYYPYYCINCLFYIIFFNDNAPSEIDLKLGEKLKKLLNRSEAPLFQMCHSSLGQQLR